MKPLDRTSILTAAGFEATSIYRSETTLRKRTSVEVEGSNIVLRETDLDGDGGLFLPVMRFTREEARHIARLLLEIAGAPE